MGAPAGAPLETANSWRATLRRCSIGLIGSDPHSAVLSWLGGERIAISGLPPRRTVRQLAEHGVTHVVNCRARPQVLMSGDLSAERAALGHGKVAHAPMWDLGQRQRPVLWAAAVAFAASALADDPQARVLIHCHWGRRRSAMVAYAVLRARGHAPDAAAALVLRYRPQAELVPNYVRSVERWLATIGAPASAPRSDPARVPDPATAAASATAPAPESAPA